MPNGIEDYIHRIGRTGRAGAKGTAYSYITPDQGRESFLRFAPLFSPFLPLLTLRIELPSTGLAKDLVKILQDAKQVVPPQLLEIAQFGGGGGRGGGGRGRGGGGGGRGYGGGGYGGGHGKSALSFSSGSNRSH
jgi:ATP-dependent RNA helicase DDX5/DBP2